MLIKEYRIPLPLTVDEFHRGQLYATSEASRQETGGGEGIEVITQQDFTSDTLRPGETLTGIYTKKKYYLRSKAPWILQKMLPQEAFELVEESWNAYPYTRTVITNPKYMKENYKLTLESIHLADNGHSDNPLNGPRKREIIYVDICDDKVIGKAAYKEDNDPKVFVSDKTKRGPLDNDWIENHEPIMCAYKLVSLHFKWTGFSNIVEKTIHRQYPKVFTLFHRLAYTLIDSWFDMSLDDIRQFEEETAEMLKKQLNDSERRGTVCDEK